MEYVSYLHKEMKRIKMMILEKWHHLNIKGFLNLEAILIFDIS